MSLGKVSIAIEAAMAGFESDMGRAQRLLEKETQRMQKDLDGFQAKAKAVGVAVGAAIVGGLTLAAAAVKGAIDDMDKLGETAQKVGLPTEQLSALTYAAKLSGVESETLNTSLIKLSKNMADTAAGTGEAQEGFAALGVNVKNADGSLKSSSQVLTEVAGKFAGYRDGAEKTALAVNLFGKSGAELVPLLNQGAEGIQQLEEQARALGVTFDTETANKAGAFNDVLDRLSSAFQGIWQQVAAQLLPGLLALANRFLDVNKAGGAFSTIATVIATGLKLVGTVAAVVVGVFKTVGEALGGVAAAFVSFVTGDFRGAFNIVQEYQADIIKNVGGTIGTVKDIWSDTAADIKADAPTTSDGIAAPMIQGEEKAKKAGKRMVDQAARDFKRAKEELDKLQRELDNYGKSDDDVKVADYAAMPGATPEMVSQYRSALSTLGVLKSMDEADEVSAQNDRDRKEAIDQVVASLTDEIAMLGMSADEQERYNALKHAGVDATSAEGQAITDLVNRMQDARKARDWMNQLSDVTYNFFAGVLDYTKGAKEAFGDFIDGIRQMVIRLLAEAALQKLGDYLKSLGSSMSGSGSSSGSGFSWGGLISAVGSAFGGGKASGGPTRAGMFYQVNENGPELYSTGGRTFLMSGGSDGRVTPLSSMPSQQPQQVRVIAVYSQEEAQRQALAAMKSPAGERVSVVHFQQNRKQMGV